MMSKLNDSHGEALTNLETDHAMVEKLNEDQFKIGRHIITRLVDNPYGINMFCKGCGFELSNFSVIVPSIHFFLFSCSFGSYGRSIPITYINYKTRC